jgi:hypothetical protein
MDLGTERAPSFEIVDDRDDESQAFFPSLSAWLKDHVYLASLIVLIAALVPRLFLTLAADPQDLVAPDSGTYFAPAMNLFEHGAFLNGRQMPEVSRTPGYPVFLSAIMAVTGKRLVYEDLRTVLVIQTVILSLSVLFLYWLARRILPPVMALIGALLAAFSPWGAVRAGFPLTEGLFILNLVVLFLAMYLVVEHITNLAAVLLGGSFVGLLTSAAVFVRPFWPLVPLVAIILFLLCGGKRQKTWILLVVVLVSASAPLYLWKTRNLREAQFDGFSNTSAVTAYRYFTSAVKAQVKGADGDRWTMKAAAEEEENRWRQQGLSLQEMNDERWRGVQAVFREHPFLSVYTFALNACESVIHPHPGILSPAKLNFYGDVWVLGGIWATLLVFAALGLSCTSNKVRDGGLLHRKWLLSLLGICFFLTIAAGLSFGGGSRFRAPLEIIVPLLAGVGLVRFVRYLEHVHTFYVPHKSPFGKNLTG